MNPFDAQKRKKNLYLVMGFWLTLLAAWLLAERAEVIMGTAVAKNVWWTVLLLFGAAITGFLFQPLVKEKFPSAKDSRVIADPRLHLKDHETLMGYYPFVALVVFLGGLLSSHMLYGDTIIFEVKSAAFWWATAITGVLNVFVFYFLTKGFRYGDLSLVSTTQAMSPLFVLPISIVAFALFGSIAPLPNPTVSRVGLAGILLTVIALVLNVLAGKKTPIKTSPPPGDWFAHHPVLSGLLGTLIGSISVNFDKISVDSANPFLAGILTMLIVAVITTAWTYAASGWRRVGFVFAQYAKPFLLVGLAYGAVILVMNITLYGANVNYYAAIKRTSAIFGIFYGMYVLREGMSARDRWIRIAVGILVIAGVFLITFHG